MFWGGIVKEGQPLKSTKIFESMEFPALHLSQAVLVKGQQNCRLSIKVKGNDNEICLAILSDKDNSKAITCYINMTQTLSLSVTGKGAEVHLCGHFESEGHEAEDEMFYGDEKDDEEDDDSEEEEAAPAKKAIVSNL